MFKSLIATCLLTFSCSGAPRQEVPHEENSEMTLNVPMLANSQSNYLYGAYCVRDTIDWDTYNDVLNDYGSDATFNYSCSCLDFNGNGVGEIHGVETFYIYAEFDSGYIYYKFGSTEGGRAYTGYFDTSDGVSETSLKTYVLFHEPYYAQYGENFDIRLFNVIFTQEGNSYNTLYTGWYTFADYYSYTGVATMQLFGSFMANNTLYTFMFASSRNNTNCIWFMTSQGDNYYYNVGGNYQSDLRNVYFTGVLIPNVYKSALNGTGVFAYVQPTQPYTFGELIFNIMDAPIYMLSQLFSFELFGVQFYVAFMSIVTLVLICFVLRKII